jgi:Rrf2 family protein
VKFSTQEEYGLRCLMQIARHGEGASLSLTQLAQLEGIGLPNVGKIMRLLRRGGFVRSTRGQSGGYTLARVPEAIVVGEVLAVLGSRLFDAEFCERYAGSEDLCTHASDCSIRPVLKQLQDAVDAVMGRLTLAQLMRGELPEASLGSGRVVGQRAVELPVQSPRAARHSPS